MHGHLYWKIKQTAQRRDAGMQCIWKVSGFISLVKPQSREAALPHRQSHSRPTYLLLLSITAAQRERDTWLYILLFSIICLLLYFLLTICLFFHFLFLFFLFFSIYLFIFCSWSLEESRCIVPGCWNYAFLISEVIIISFEKYDSIYQNHKRQKAGFWVHVTDENTGGIKLPWSRLRCNVFPRCAGDRRKRVTAWREISDNYYKMLSISPSVSLVF